MKKIFISIFLISFIFNFANAEEVKKNKTDAEWIKEFQDLEKQENETKQEIKDTKARIEKLDKAQKTVDEIKNKLGVDKK